MPLIALITDSMAKLHEVIPNVSAVHLTASTLQEAMCAVYIFTSPEVLLDRATGYVLLQTKSVAENIRVIFLDEFHVVSSWLVAFMHSLMIFIHNAKVT